MCSECGHPDFVHRNDAQLAGPEPCTCHPRNGLPPEPRVFDYPVEGYHPYVQADAELTRKFRERLDKWLAHPEALTSDPAEILVRLAAEGLHIIEMGKENVAPNPDAMCDCHHTMRFHNVTSKGTSGCQMAGCRCRQFKLKASPE